MNLHMSPADEAGVAQVDVHLPLGRTVSSNHNFTLSH